MSKTHNLLVVAGTVLLASAGPTFAATVSVGESYSVTELGFTGNAPGISDDLSHNGTLNLTKNVWSAPTDFFTASPDSRSGLSGMNPTVIGTLTVTLHFTEAGGVTGSLTETGIFEAKYGGTPLAGCTSSPAGDTDCIVWNGAPNTPTGSVVLAATLSNGEIMDVDFYNAQDWNITPKISFDLDPTPTPLPAALPMFAGGLGMLGFLTRRKKRTARQQSAVA